MTNPFLIHTFVIPISHVRESYLLADSDTMNHNYFIYIVTNPLKTVLYIGVTNDLTTRLRQHYDNRGNTETFAGKYFCYNLLYWERYQYIDHAIEREKEIKKWNRAKKERLISEFNPQWRFLNNDVKED